MDDDDFILDEPRRQIVIPPTPLNVVPTRINDQDDISTNLFETKKRISTPKGSKPLLSLKIVRTRPERKLISAEMELNDIGLHLEIDRAGKLVNGPFPLEFQEKVASILKEFELFLKTWSITISLTPTVLDEAPRSENKAILQEPPPSDLKKIEKEISTSAEPIPKSTKAAEFQSLIRPPEIQTLIPGMLKFKTEMTLRKTVHDTLLLGLRKELIKATCLKGGAQFELSWDGNSIVFTPQKTKVYPVRLFDMSSSLSVTFPIAFTPSALDPEARFRWNIVAGNKLELVEVRRGEEQKNDLKLREATSYRKSHLLTLDKKIVSELKLSAGMHALWSVVGNSHQLEFRKKKQYFVNVVHNGNPTNHTYYIALPREFVSGKLHEHDVVCLSTNEKGQLIASPFEETLAATVASSQPAASVCDIARDPVRHLNKNLE